MCRVKDVEEISEERRILEEKVIEKLYELKILNPITKDLETDIEIIKPILASRIMNLENVSIQVISEWDVLEVNIYDGKIPEYTFNVKNINNIQAKGKKKIKLFIK